MRKLWILILLSILVSLLISELGFIEGLIIFSNSGDELTLNDFIYMVIGALIMFSLLIFFNFISFINSYIKQSKSEK